jgi:hypothetical protein
MSGTMLLNIGAVSAGLKYTYVGQASLASTSAYGGSSVPGLALLPTAPPSTASQKLSCIVTDGSFIATTNAYSLNSGSTWTSWNGSQTDVTNIHPPGLNGSAGYNPIAKRMGTYYVTYDPHTSSNYAFYCTVSSTGSTTAAFGGVLSGTIKNVIYSPALDSFYGMDSGGSATNVTYWNGTTGAFTGTISYGQSGGYKAGISDTGYVMQASYVGFGTSYYMRFYTSADFSTNTNMGTIVNAYQSDTYKSPFFWAPVSNKYLLASNFNTTSTLRIVTSTSANPHQFTLIASFSLGASVYSANYINFMEQTNGVLWVYGMATQVKYYGLLPFTFFSTDGGVTWTATSGTAMANISKNFTP